MDGVGRFWRGEGREGIRGISKVDWFVEIGVKEERSGLMTYERRERRRGRGRERLFFLFFLR
jgi:hypothetical protein